jgi:hypothetical protein
MQKHSKSVEPTVPNLETVWNIDPQAFETLNNTYRAWLDQASRMRDEAIRFTQERFAKELDVAVRLSKCTSATEAIALQTEFANDTAADYIAEGQRFVGLMGEMTKQISSTVRAHH